MLCNFSNVLWLLYQCWELPDSSQLKAIWGYQDLPGQLGSREGTQLVLTIHRSMDHSSKTQGINLAPIWQIKVPKVYLFNSNKNPETDPYWLFLSILGHFWNLKLNLLIVTPIPFYSFVDTSKGIVILKWNSVNRGRQCMCFITMN